MTAFSGQLFSHYRSWLEISSDAVSEALISPEAQADSDPIVVFCPLRDGWRTKPAPFHNRAVTRNRWPDLNPFNIAHLFRRVVFERQRRFDVNVGMRSAGFANVFWKWNSNPLAVTAERDCCVFVPLICFQPRNGKRIDAEARRLIFGRMIIHKVPAWNPCGWFWGCCRWQQVSEVLARSYCRREI